jgi:hypothetical protein
LNLRADEVAGGSYQPISNDHPDLVAGQNTDVTFRLNWGAGSLGPSSQLSRLMLILATNATGLGSLYVDRLRLVYPCGLPGFSPSPTPSHSPTQAPTTAGPQGPLKILAAQACPDPNPSFLAVELAGPSDSAELWLYSTSMQLVQRWSVGPMHSGWNRFELGSAWSKGLASGVYFGALRARRGDEHSDRILTKMMVLH